MRYLRVLAVVAAVFLLCGSVLFTIYEHQGEVRIERDRSLSEVVRLRAAQLS